MYDVISPCGNNGSDHVSETAVELTTVPLKLVGGSPGTKDQRKMLIVDY